MKLGERSEEGIFSRMTLEFDTHLVRLKPRVLRHEISNKDNLNSLHQKKNLKSSLAITPFNDLSTISGTFLNA